MRGDFSMYDKERITKIIADIEKFQRELGEMKIVSKEDLQKVEKKHAVAMVSFAILNRVIDLGQEILIAEKRGMPSRYADISLELAKAGVMNKNEAEEINKLIELRNIIAHTYFELGEKEIWRLVQGKSTITKYIEQIKKRVSGKK